MADRLPPPGYLHLDPATRPATGVPVIFGAPPQLGQFRGMNNTPVFCQLSSSTTLRPHQDAAAAAAALSRMIAQPHLEHHRPVVPAFRSVRKCGMMEKLLKTKTTPSLPSAHLLSFRCKVPPPQGAGLNSDRGDAAPRISHASAGQTAPTTLPHVFAHPVRGRWYRTMRVSDAKNASAPRYIMSRTIDLGCTDGWHYGALCMQHPWATGTPPDEKTEVPLDAPADPVGLGSGLPIGPGGGSSSSMSAASLLVQPPTVLPPAPLPLSLIQAQAPAVTYGGGIPETTLPTQVVTALPDLTGAPAPLCQNKKTENWVAGTVSLALLFSSFFLPLSSSSLLLFLSVCPVVSTVCLTQLTPPLALDKERAAAVLPSNHRASAHAVCKGAPPLPPLSLCLPFSTKHTLLQSTI